MKRQGLDQITEISAETTATTHLPGILSFLQVRSPETEKIIPLNTANIRGHKCKLQTSLYILKVVPKHRVETQTDL